MAFSRILGQALVGQVLVRTCSNYFSKLICDCSCHSSRKRMWIFFQCSSSKQAVLITANRHLVYGHPWWGRHLSLRLSKVCSAVEGYGVKRQQHHFVSIRHCYVAKYLQVLHDALKNLLVWTNLCFLLANETNKRFTLGIAELTSDCKLPMWTVGASPNLAFASASKILVQSTYFAGIAVAMLSQKASMMSRSAPVWGACATIKMVFQ